MGYQEKFNEDILLAKAGKVFEMALEDKEIRRNLRELYMGKDHEKLAGYLEKTFGINEEESRQIRDLFRELERPSPEKASLWV